MRCNIMKKIRKSCNNKSHKKTTNKEYTIQELMELGEKTNQLKLAEPIKKDKDSLKNKRLPIIITLGNCCRKRRLKIDSKQ